jgi:predicted DNA binding protein
MGTETKNDGWFVRLLLPDREALNHIWNYARDNDITFDIVEVYGNEDTSGESSYGLTEQQRAALRLAYRRGYFQEPRDVSLDEVAQELGLSSTAMSGRLRRGIRNLVAATIAEDEPPK